MNNIDKSKDLAAIEGGDGRIQEPDWSGIFNDELDIEVAHEHWLTVAANLRVDRKQSIAPHKPLLLHVLAGLA